MTTPADAHRLLSAARARYRARDPAAEALYRAVLAQRPDHLESLDRCARYALYHGRPAEAAALLERALARRPAETALLRLFGQALRRCGRPAEAAAALRRALVLTPADPGLLSALGQMARADSAFERAAALFRRAVQVAPADAEGWKALGLALTEGEHPEAAAAAYAAGTRACPDDGELWFNHGITLRRLGRPAAALPPLKRAVEAMDPPVPALRALGRALLDVGRKDEARPLYERLLALDPADANTWLVLGGLRKDQGDQERAVRLLERIPRPPGLSQAGLALAMARLPMVYRATAEIESSRAAYAADLAGMAAAPPPETPAAVAAAADAVGASQPYYLPYQNQDDRDLQARYGALVHDSLARRYPAWTKAPAVALQAAGAPLRVGLVSGFFRWHTIWKLFLRGWIGGLDPARVTLTAYATQAPDEATAARLRECGVRLVVAQSFEQVARTVRTDANHVLLWPEVGMDPLAARLACLRLAPVQCVSWGHPVTTGLPTMDVFLTSDLMEPPGEAARYTERVVRLPGLGIAYPPLPVPAEPADFAAHGIPDEAPLYLCCQYLSKYLPQHDRLLARIARRVPGARFAFIAIRRPVLEAILRARLEAAFAAEGLRAGDHVVILPYMQPGVYAALNDRADVYLDTIGWSGGNTTLEAVAHGLPVVTLPGPFMRGRHSAAILTHLGVGETIARDEEDYVEIAVRLGTDAAWRAEVSRRTRAGLPRLFEDTTPLRALEDALDALARGRG